MLKTRLDYLEEQLGYCFKKQQLLKDALRHSSLETKVSNERLEFLGDRVLGLVISDYLYNGPILSEGDMAKKLNFLVRRETCAEVAKKLQLGAAISMATSEEDNGGREKVALLANACEAVIAAIYLDGGFEVAKKVVLSLWSDWLIQPLQPLSDPKSLLQEWSQARRAGLPIYRLIGRRGSDHQPIFLVSVEIIGYGQKQAEGNSKKTAEHEAARLLYESLVERKN